MAEAAVLVGGGAVSAYGQLMQGQAAKQAGEYNAQVAEQNAMLSLQQSKEEERKFRIQARRQVGEIKASYGASGVQLEGSPLDVLEDNVEQMETDAQSIRQNGINRAVAFKNQARLDRFQGEMGLQGSYFSAAGSLLGAGSQAYGKMKRTS